MKYSHLFTADLHDSGLKKQPFVLPHPSAENWEVRTNHTNSLFNMWLHYQMYYLNSLMIYLPYWICFHQQMRIIDIYENILALNFFKNLRESYCLSLYQVSWSICQARWLNIISKLCHYVFMEIAPSYLALSLLPISSNYEFPVHN